MASTIASATTFDTRHDDMIHDAQADYYGKRVATCSSDRTIKVFELGADNSMNQTAELKGHEAPVWQVAWAHPQFGSILASCSYDHKVFIWKETQANAWQKIYEFRHDSSVNAIAWAPQELGLILATASSDRTIAIITYNEQDPNADTFTAVQIRNAHEIGCNAVSWAPAMRVGSLTNSDASAGAGGADSLNRNLVKQVASGGGDNLIKIWTCIDGTWQKEPSETLEGHMDWVRDVQWAPNIGLPYDTLASCGQDKRVLIYTRGEQTGWKKEEIKFQSVVWRVSWSLVGNILAVSTADNQVSLFKEIDGQWVKLSTLEDQQQAGVHQQ